MRKNTVYYLDDTSGELEITFRDSASFDSKKEILCIIGNIDSKHGPVFIDSNTAKFLVEKLSEELKLLKTNSIMYHDCNRKYVCNNGSVKEAM